MALVNVIVPAYNCGAYIGDALESALSQSLADVEPIVVDDGSTDDTREIVGRFGGRVRYYYQANQGPGAARNVALHAATAPYCAFLDADDIWEPDHLLVKHRVLEADGDLGGVFSDFSIFSGDGVFVARGGRETFPSLSRSGNDFDDIFESRTMVTLANGRPAALYRGKVFDSLFLGNFILPTSMLVRREAAAATGEFRLDLRTQQDYEYWLRFAQKFRLGYVDEPLVRYRRHAKQLTDPSRMEAIMLAVDRVVSQYEPRFAQTGRQRFFDRRKASILGELAKVYVSQGRSAEARARLYESLRRSPSHWSSYTTFGISLVPDTWLNWARRYF